MYICDRQQEIDSVHLWHTDVKTGPNFTLLNNKPFIIINQTALCDRTILTILVYHTDT